MTKSGLVEIGDGIHAYLQPKATWGWSNAGLVVGEESSLLVDTLFDLRLTAEMLRAMQPHTAKAPITKVVNTHANGDHCYGNQLLAGAEFIASKSTSREIEEVPPSLMALLLKSAPDGNLARFVQHAFGEFHFDGIEVPPITTTVSESLELDVSGVRVHLRVVGPAHTGGDLIVWLPDQRIVFVGDILFIGSTPIMWAGPIDNWIAACSFINELDPAVVVPGHGPITDAQGVADVADYLTFVRDASAKHHQAGMTPIDAAHEIDRAINGTKWSNWTERERLVATVHAVWRDLDPTYQPPDAVGLLGLMADDFTSRNSG